MSVPLRVLIVEDSEDDAVLIVRELKRGGYDPVFERVDTPEAFGAALSEQAWNVIISDYSMPRFSGLAALEMLRESGLDLPFIVVSGAIGEDIAVEAMRTGAHDYVMKGNLTRLSPAVRRELSEAGVRLARRQAEEALHQHAKRLRVLHEIDQAILEARSPQEIVEATLVRIRELIPCQRATVELFDLETGEDTVFVADCNGETRIRAGMNLSLDEYDGIEGLRRGEIRMVEDLMAVAPLSPVGQALCAEGVRSFVSVPLVSRGRLIGALSIGMGSPGAISVDYVDIAREVADQLAVAIQNARLAEAERRRSAELEALRQASLHVTSSLELQPVLEAILEHTLDLVSADNIHIFLNDGEKLSFGAAMWARGVGKEPFTSPRPEGMTYNVARSGERIVVSDMSSHPLFQGQSWVGGIASLPLCFGEHVCGVMNVAFGEPHISSENELNALELLADQAAIAIHNANLHQQVRRHAEELAAALARQEELDRLKGEFIQNVSHELRSPLAIIRGYTEMLRDGEMGELTPDQEKPVSIIARRALMLSDLVKDITLILEAEARPLEREPVMLDEIVFTAASDFRMAADQAGLSLTAEVADSLPSVTGSYSYLRRVLDNLLSNAIKFTPEGGAISVHAWKEDERVVLEVRDTGVGIPSDQLGRIFERFYQVDGSARRKYGGVGLGLALVKEITELHGGQVTVESQLGEGSAFAVVLPVADVGKGQ
jgi:signal transduction histidine kinase/CheY-like chemotaxis protein